MSEPTWTGSEKSWVWWRKNALSLSPEVPLNKAIILYYHLSGPDGDLGSNEIKMGKEKIIGIVDGSGVLYDP